MATACNIHGFKYPASNVIRSTAIAIAIAIAIPIPIVIAGDVRTKIAKELQGVLFVSLTTDTWSDQYCHSWMAVTAHWLGSDFRNNERAVLRVMKLKCSHTADK